MPKSRTLYIRGGNMNITLVLLGFFIVSIIISIAGVVQTYLQTKIIGKSAEEVSRNIVQNSEGKIVKKVVDELLKK